jgi:hypothetical protein
LKKHLQFCKCGVILVKGSFSAFYRVKYPKRRKNRKKSNEKSLRDEEVRQSKTRAAMLTEYFEKKYFLQDLMEQSL